MTQRAVAAVRLVPDPDAPPPVGRAELVVWLRRRIAGMAHGATDQIWGEIPSYRASDLHADVAQHCERIFGVFLATVEDDREPSVDDFPWTAEHARKRVEAGISLIDFLKAFRIAQLTLWEHILSFAREYEGSEQTFLGLVSHVMRTIEAGSSAAARTYLEAQQYEVADHERAQRELVEDLLAGRPVTGPAEAVILREGGLVDDVPFVVATVRLLDEVTDTHQETLAMSARIHLSRIAGGIFVVRHHELVALVPARQTVEAALTARFVTVVDELAERGIRLRVGLSTARTDLTRVPDAHTESVLACETLGVGHGAASLADLTTFDYLVRRPDETVRRLIRPQIRAFFTEDMAGDGTYSDSVRAYVEHHLNAREAAKELHVHVNTLYYRLERIAERTGCDLRRIDQVIELLLAIRIITDERAAG